jgi:M6 family metalloprotease-like protein
MNILLIILLFTALSFPQQRITKISDDQPGGIFLPSEGRVHTLSIFIQFPDDDFDPGNAQWRKNDVPQRIKENTWIDAEWTGKPTEWSITDYFNVMSFGKLKFTGKSISITAPRTRQWYQDNGKRLSDIHRDIIEEADKKIDFAEFDRWTRIKNFEHKEAPDGIVDFVFFIWRNINLDLPGEEAPQTLSKLGFGWLGISGVHDVSVDNGKRKINSTSGVTIQDFFSKDPFWFCVHEFGHYLVGGNEYHNGQGFWALLNGYGSRYIMVNSFERHRLGWSTFQTIPAGAGLTDVKLGDYLTTGDALRIVIDEKRNQYFYLENHQRISKWDYTSVDPDEKGIYVLRRNMTAGDNRFMQIIPAEGKFHWEVTGFVYPDYYPQGVPVFRRLAPDRKEGYLGTEFVPFEYGGQKYKPWEIIFYEDTLSGKPVESPINRQGTKDAFRPEYKTVFSPWSNPPSFSVNNTPTGIGFFIKKVNKGVVELSVYTDSSTAGPPSMPDRPELRSEGNNVVIRWTGNEEPDAAGYYIYKIENGREEQVGRVDRNATEFRYRTRRAGDRNVTFSISCFDRGGEESKKSEIGQWIN